MILDLRRTIDLFVLKSWNFLKIFNVMKVKSLFLEFCNAKVSLTTESYWSVNFIFIPCLSSSV